MKRQRHLVLLLLAFALAGCALPAAPTGTALVPLSTLNPPAAAATATALAAPAAILLPAVRAETAASPAAPAAGAAAYPDVTAYPGRVATEWFKLLVQLVKRAPGFTPPVAARAFGYAGVTLYEALVPGMPGYQSLAGQLNEMPAMPQPPDRAALYWPAVANAALAQIARALYPTINDAPLRLINKLEAKLSKEMASATPADVLTASRAYGRSVADAVFAWSKSDGGHEGYLHNVSADFVPAVGDGLWVATMPDYAPPQQPAWGDNRPLALDSNDACAAPPPLPFSTDPDSAFYKDAREVYDTVRNLTPEQDAIALFWADDAGVTATPPGHSLSITTQVLEQEQSTLAFAAQIYAQIGIALNDAFIACWKTKYIYNVVRPITYIQQVIDPDWNSPDPTDPVRTPPFPEYTSGHSVEVRAAAEILTAAFGDNYRFTDITHVDRGLAPRTYDSFYAAAAEAAISRLYGGIHYRTAIEQGLAQGACVGKRVLALQFKTP